MYHNKIILITGATGTIGKIFLKHILTYKPKYIIVFSRDEYKQYLLKKELMDPRIIFYIGDITDISSLYLINERIDILVHCAAMKHVTICEENPEMAMKTNIDGSTNIITFAINRNIDKVIFISTDKANNPNNFYGMTKAIGDKLCIKANSRSKTIFSVIRFGNIFGSRGSVLETYKNILKTTNVLPITDKNICRYFILDKELGPFLNNIIQNMKGGEIFIPRMKCMKIKDIGLALNPNVKFKVIGLQYGERFMESIVSEDEQYIYQFKDYIAIYVSKQDHKPFSIEKFKRKYYTLKEIKTIINE